MAKDNDFSAWKPVVMETCDRYPELAVFISALLQAMFHFFHEAILQPDSRCRAFVCDTRKNEPEVVDAIVDIGEICIFDKRKVEPQLSQLRAWIKKTFPTKEPPAGAGEDQTTLWKDRVAINAAIAGMLKYLTWLCWKCEGTLAFAYHNVNGNMTGYKIRSVTDKQFSQFTIARTGEQGVFPYRYAKSLLEADTEQGAVVAANEGELNSIQVLSAQRRIGIIPPEVIPLSLGSSKNHDIVTIKRLAGKRDLVVLCDNDEAGAELLKHLPNEWRILSPVEYANAITANKDSKK